MEKIESKRVKDIIQATFPNYRRREVYVTAGTVTMHGLNWSGGSRSEYRACTLDGRPIQGKYDMNSPAPWNNPFEGQRIEVPEGVAIVEGGYFCGKVARLHITVNPANMPKFLTA